MRINLKDQTPVQKTYYSMPRSLYTEFKNYIVDLFNKGWIKKAESSYASQQLQLERKMVVYGFAVITRYSMLKQSQTQIRYLVRVQYLLDSLFGKMVLSIRLQKSIPPDIFRWRKSTFDRFCDSMGLVRMGQGSI